MGIEDEVVTQDSGLYQEFRPPRIFGVLLEEDGRQSHWRVASNNPVEPNSAWVYGKTTKWLGPVSSVLPVDAGRILASGPR